MPNLRRGMPLAEPRFSHLTLAMEQGLNNSLSRAFSSLERESLLHMSDELIEEMDALDAASLAAYTADLVGATEVTQTEADSVIGVQGGLLTRMEASPSFTQLAGEAGAAIVGFSRPETGAVSQTLEEIALRVGSVKDFGAVGDGITDDTASIQAAVDALDHVHFPPGVYKVVASAVSPFTYGNSSTPVYYAVNINKSGLRLIGDSAAIELYGVDNPSGTEINYAFSTDKNMTLGALTDIRISGLDFDFTPKAGKFGTTYRSLHVVGVRGLFLDNLHLYSTGSRYGATITIQNSEQIRMSNIRMRNVTQGMNFSYVDDVQMSNLMFDYFSEAIDFDRKASRVNANNLNFVSTFGTGSGQCMDLNSVSNSSLTNISAENCGNVAYINFKQTTPPTYADYVNNAPITVYSPSHNVTIDGLKMIDCGAGTNAINVSDDFDTEPGVLTRDITIRNVTMVESGSIEVRMAINVLLENITCINPYPNLAAGYALFFILQGTRVNARASATLKNITVKGMATSQDVIRSSGAEYCIMDNIHVENYPQDAIEISSPPAGSHYAITNSRFLRTVDTVVTGIAVRLTNVVSENVQFDWSNNIITQYTTPFSVSNAAAGRLLPSRSVGLGTQAFTSGTKRISLYCDLNKTAYIGDIRCSALTAAASGTNYVSYTIRKNGTSIGSSSDTAGITTGVPYGVGFVTPEALALVAPGECIYLEATATGTGRTLDAFDVKVYYAEFISV